MGTRGEEQVSYCDGREGIENCRDHTSRRLPASGWSTSGWLVEWQEGTRYVWCPDCAEVTIRVDVAS